MIAYSHTGQKQERLELGTRRVSAFSCMSNRYTPTEVFGAMLGNRVYALT